MGGSWSQRGSEIIYERLFAVPVAKCALKHQVQPRCWRDRTARRYRMLIGRAETERDGTCTETRFGFPAKRTSPFISAGVSVQSAAGSRGVRISGSNAG